MKQLTVWAFAEMDADDPETWYPDPPKGIMKEIYQHQSLWDNRQHPRVHAVFSQIIGTEKLMVSRDRASINPPDTIPRPSLSPARRAIW